MSFFFGLSHFNSHSHGDNLAILSATTTLALGCSVLYLWRLTNQLQARVEELEYHSHHGRRFDLKDVSQSDEGSPRKLGRSLLHDDHDKEREIVMSEFEDLPQRFLNAGGGDEDKGRERLSATLEWRKENDMDTCLYKAWPHYSLIKQHYPHYFHGKGLKGEVCFYEQPPKTNLKAMREGGVDLQGLLKHYAMICEFQWQYVSRDDMNKSIYIIDLDGMGMSDFVGECKEFVRLASEFASAHYPERAGVVLVINVPYWFKMVWNVVSKWVDPVTLEKIFILRGQEEILNTLKEKIPLENIPKDYGGESPYALGESLEEQLLKSLMQHNNDMADNDGVCPNANQDEPCRYCNFKYARHY